MARHHRPTASIDPGVQGGTETCWCVPLVRWFGYTRWILTVQPIVSLADISCTMTETEKPYKIVRASDLPDPDPDQKWLVNDLWTLGGVGIIGGEPKCFKTWLGLDIAFSVASGTPVLGRFDVPDHAQGNVLI